MDDGDSPQPREPSVGASTGRTGTPTSTPPASHTAEPWREWTDSADGSLCVFGGKNSLEFVALFAAEGLPQKERERALRDRRRAIAAVNACAGLSTRALEAELVRRVLTSFEDLVDLAGLFVEIDAGDTPRISERHAHGLALLEELKTGHGARGRS